MNNGPSVKSDINLTFTVDMVTKMATNIAPDKAAHCVITQLLGPKNAVKLFSVRTKTQ